MKLLYLTLSILFLTACANQSQRMPASIDRGSCFIKIQRHFALGSSPYSSPYKDQLAQMKFLFGQNEIQEIIENPAYSEFFLSSTNESEKEYYATILLLLKKDENLDDVTLKQKFQSLFEC
ncbi:putative lipoprotein [Bacteriovorax sp. BSW11_IV]|uniref:hypothetical protein n=1 Tax=Bacteriovorax sp. BSW11_IV TaxID=1353529 RepID=UPI000389F990|nr:hypothetical protein [Bacteriovorax sp. BSW11_IV]EQC49130.1 putative lipoprotein [Bacteriovorax sp. BSW11_IV]